MVFGARPPLNVLASSISMTSVQNSQHFKKTNSKLHPMTKSCISFLSMPHTHRMSDISFGTQGRIVCIRFCKKVPVCKLQRGEYLMRRHDFGKNFLPARVMKEDISPFARQPKHHLCPCNSAPRNKIILFQIRQVLLECGYTQFPSKTGK